MLDRLQGDPRQAEEKLTPVDVSFASLDLPADTFAGDIPN
jgi:hypothetical protein